jgi:biopolymer transport protein ExbD
MITRPLDLAAKLRLEPRNFDFLFYVNGGLIVLFFSMFGSRFVLAPGLGVDFQMAQMPPSALGAARTTTTISVRRDGVIFAERGPVTLPQLREWLREQAKGTKQPVLLVRSDASVMASVLTEIFTTATEEGFNVVVGAESTPTKTEPFR